MNTRLQLIGCAVATLVLGAGIVPAQEEPRAVIVPGNLATDPAGEKILPAGVYGPTPSVTERWRDGLADIEARYDTDLAALRGLAAAAVGEARADAERQVQVRKLDFELEVFALQLALLPAAGPADKGDADADVDREAAVAALQAAAATLRELRERLAEGGASVVRPVTTPHEGE